MFSDVDCTVKKSCFLLACLSLLNDTEWLMVALPICNYEACTMLRAMAHVLHLTNRLRDYIFFTTSFRTEYKEDQQVNNCQ